MVFLVRNHVTPLHYHETESSLSEVSFERSHSGRSAIGSRACKCRSHRAVGHLSQPGSVSFQRPAVDRHGGLGLRRMRVRGVVCHGSGCIEDQGGLIRQKSSGFGNLAPCNGRRRKPTEVVDLPKKGRAHAPACFTLFAKGYRMSGEASRWGGLGQFCACWRIVRDRGEDSGGSP